MKFLSMLVESIRVANKLDHAGPRAGLDGAHRFATEYCRPGREQVSEAARSGEFEMIDAAFMKLI